MAAVVESEIQKLDQTPARLEWEGTATLADKNCDGLVEALEAGRWTGTFRIAGQTATLALSPANSFRGVRAGL
jgi:hypothetical protein